MEDASLSSDDQDYQSASEKISPPASFLLAIQIAFAFRISQLRKSPLPIAAGLPRLQLPSKASSGSPGRRKSLSQPNAEAGRLWAIAERIQKDFGPQLVFGRAEEFPSSRSGAFPAGGECTRAEDFSPVDSVVLSPIYGSGIQPGPALRRRPKSATVPVDAACRRVPALVDNGFEHAEEESEYPQERSTEIDLEGNVLEESVGSQFQQVPREGLQESEISSDSSVQHRACRNNVPSLTTGSQLRKTSSWSTGYESDLDDDVGSAEREASCKKRGDNEGLDEESETQTDRLQGRPTPHPEEGREEGASVYRIPEEQTEQSSSFLLWPIELAVAAVQFQVRLIVEGISLIGSLFSWCNSFASHRIEETLHAKDRATEAVSQRATMISQVPPKVTEGGTYVLKRAAWGCLAAAYVCLLLIMLLLPALVLDFAFVSKIVEEPASIRESIHFDYTAHHPTALVSLRSLHGDGGSRGKVAPRAIPLSHKVHVTVMLTLPESDYNRNIGMFQLTAELLSENGNVIKSSSRPCMLKFHSAPVRLLKTFIVSLPLLMGMFSESQTLILKLMEFEEQNVLTSAVRILLQPKAGMTLGAGIPEIYSAEVCIESHLPWPKELLRNWKWTFYVWTALGLYMLEILIVLCFCRQALMPKIWLGQTKEVNLDRRVGRGNTTSLDMSEGASH